MSQWEKPKVHTTQCGCNYDRDHNVVFSFWKEPGFGDELTIAAGLNHYRGFFSRAWIGFKYALGIDNTYCSYTETVLDKTEVIKLRDFLCDIADEFEEPVHPADVKLES